MTLFEQIGKNPLHYLISRPDLVKKSVWAGKYSMRANRFYVHVLTLKDAGFLKVFFWEKGSLSYQIYFQMKI